MSVSEAYNQYKDLLYWYSRRFAWDDPDTRQEIVQDTFVRVLRSGAVLEEDKAVSYLLRTMYSVVIDMYKKSAARVFRNSVDIIDQCAREDILYSKIYDTGHNQDIETIWEELQKISPKWAVLWKKHLSGYRYKDIAKETGLPIGTVKAGFYRLKQKAMQNIVIKDMRN